MLTADEIDPALGWAAKQLEETGWAAELCDANWRLVWVSSQLRALLGAPEDDSVGVGEHMFASRFRDVAPGMGGPMQERWARENVPFMLDDTPGGRAALSAMIPPELPRFQQIVDEAEAWGRPVWTSVLDFRGTGVELGTVRYFGVRARDRDGKLLGIIYIYGTTLPATLLALVARGNQRLFERMARLVEPGRREAAILFADLQASGALSRRLPSAGYFSLVRDLTTAMDAAIIESDGIVGKHAGDGVTAFFLADDLGGPSHAACASVTAARRLAAAAEEIAAARPELEPGDVRLNMGVHWGGTLYMGQVVTDGRLEVTALGDEVNEAARLQQAARDGAILVSKSIVERLDADDARDAGLDPDSVVYRAVAEVAPGDDKIVRDAGTIAVTALSV